MRNKFETSWDLFCRRNKYDLRYGFMEEVNCFFLQDLGFDPDLDHMDLPSAASQKGKAAVASGALPVLKRDANPPPRLRTATEKELHASIMSNPILASMPAVWDNILASITSPTPVPVPVPVDPTPSEAHAWTTIV
jgi:hypothetical protein